MKFLELDDFLQCIDEKAFSTVKGADESKVLTAERTAMDEAAGYLDKYSTQKLYSLTGNNRPAKFVSILCDIALYHLICSLPGRMGYDIRKERYDLAIDWLNRIQAGKVTPVGFPPKSEDNSGGTSGDGSGDEYSGSISMSSEKKNNYVW